MKKWIITLNIALMSLAAGAQMLAGYGYYEPQKKKANLPRSFEWVEGHSLALKQTEVTIGEYLSFLDQVYNDSSILNPSLIPKAPCILAGFVNAGDVNGMPWFDQKGFNQAHRYNEKDDYPIYNYPITGLSYEQAITYANWCSRYWTDRNATLGIGQKFSFRLLSPSEHEKYEEQGITKCYEKSKPEVRTKFVNELRDCKNEKHCALCNYFKKDSCEANIRLMKKFGNETYPVAVFFPSCIGVYDMQGNVAEMTTEKGVAKGGSYLNPARECLPQAAQQYDSPQSWLGFRLIVSVEKMD